MLNAPIKAIGQYKVPLALHPEVETTVTVIVARSADEAERIARGEDVTVRRTDAEEEAAVAAAAAAALFDPEAQAIRERDESEAGADASGSACARGDGSQASEGGEEEERMRPERLVGFLFRLLVFCRRLCRIGFRLGRLCGSIALASVGLGVARLGVALARLAWPRRIWPRQACRLRALPRRIWARMLSARRT